MRHVKQQSVIVIQRVYLLKFSILSLRPPPYTTPTFVSTSPSYHNSDRDDVCEQHATTSLHDSPTPPLHPLPQTLRRAKTSATLPSLQPAQPAIPAHGPPPRTPLHDICFRTHPPLPHRTLARNRQTHRLTPNHDREPQHAVP